MPLETEPLGRKAVAYWSSSQVLASLSSGDIDTWINHADTKVVADIFDVTENTTPEYADTTTRGAASGGYTSRKPVIKEGEVSFEMIWATTEGADGWVQKVIDSTNADDVMTMAFLDYNHQDPSASGGEIAQGLIGNFYMNFVKSENIRDVQRAQVTAVNRRELTWHKFSIT